MKNLIKETLKELETYEIDHDDYFKEHFEILKEIKRIDLNVYKNLKCYVKDVEKWFELIDSTCREFNTLIGNNNINHVEEYFKSILMLLEEIKKVETENDSVKALLKRLISSVCIQGLYIEPHFTAEVTQYQTKGILLLTTGLKKMN